ncbi:MAG TPA: hypothetical protein VH639_05040 [Bryobacteraceae bacterium]|jgi:hypothetical protein
MTAKFTAIFVLLILASRGAHAQSAQSREPLPKFMGREVTVTIPELDADGFFPKGPATVCVEAPPQRQCYTAPKDFGRTPSVEVIQMNQNTTALFFSAAGGGVSGWRVHYALLRPGKGKDLENLFSLELSNQSEHAFWRDTSISDSPIFVIADYVWGPDEAHYSDHRYTISAYLLMASSLIKQSNYFRDDEYMTVRHYSPEDPNILNSEKPEILARLKRVKAEREREQKDPR